MERVIFLIFEKIMCSKLKTLLAIIAMLVAVSLSLGSVSYSPQEQPRAAESSVEICRARIVVAGDLMQHASQLVAAMRSDGRYDYTTSFQYVAPYFQNADLAIVNLETTLSYEGPYSGYPAFCSPAAVADALRDMDIDVVAMANNHCCDKGGRGVRATCSILDSYGLNRVGVYCDSIDYKLNRVCYLKRRNIRFAVVNYTYDTNGVPIPKGQVVNLIDTLAIARDLATINRDEVDCVVAVMHWGYEYQRAAHPEQRRLAAFLQRNGVDLIIGSHPHVVQPVERSADGRLTLYSLGNFVSNQRKRYSDGGLIAAIDVEIRDSLHDGKVVATTKSYDLELIPVWVLLPEYIVLPKPVGDALPMNGDSRAAYNIFVEDTEKLLNLK